MLVCNFSFLYLVIRGQNWPFVPMFFLFSLLFLRYQALVSFSPFQRRISPCPPLPLPPSAIVGLWSSPCLSARTRRLQSSAISGLCHMRMCVCVFVYYQGWSVHGKRGGAHMFSHLSSLSQFTLTHRARTTSTSEKISSCPQGAESDLLRSTGDRRRMSVYYIFTNIQPSS